MRAIIALFEKEGRILQYWLLRELCLIMYRNL